ncbi:MAG: DUF5692 family protein, partial [Acetivibrio ethanolgignens]
MGSYKSYLYPYEQLVSLCKALCSNGRLYWLYGGWWNWVNGIAGILNILCM